MCNHTQLALVTMSINLLIYPSNIFTWYAFWAPHSVGAQRMILYIRPLLLSNFYSESPNFWGPSRPSTTTHPKTPIKDMTSDRVKKGLSSAWTCWDKQIKRFKICLQEIHRALELQKRRKKAKVMSLWSCKVCISSIVGSPGQVTLVKSCISPSW